MAALDALLAIEADRTHIARDPDSDRWRVFQSELSNCAAEYVLSLRAPGAVAPSTDILRKRVKDMVRAALRGCP